MAHEIPGIMDSLVSTGDMSSHQYKAVDASTSSIAQGAALVAARGAKLIGVWQENSTAQTHGNVMYSGVSKVAAGDSSGMENGITLGTKVVASSQGQAVPSTGAGLHLIGTSLGTLSTGSTGIIPVLLAIGAIST